MNIYEILTIIIISAIAIRISLKFDLNKYLENRRKIKINQLKNIYPHCKIEFVGDKQVKVESYFYTDFGNPNYVCSRCGCVVPFEENAEMICKNYAKDPKRWLEHENKFIKQMKKLKLA